MSWGGGKWLFVGEFSRRFPFGSPLEYTTAFWFCTRSTATTIIASRRLTNETHLTVTICLYYTNMRTIYVFSVSGNRVARAVGRLHIHGVCALRAGRSDAVPAQTQRISGGNCHGRRSWVSRTFCCMNRGATRPTSSAGPHRDSANYPCKRLQHSSLFCIEKISPMGRFHFESILIYIN